jgi:hypothetical protein
VEHVHERQSSPIPTPFRFRPKFVRGQSPMGRPTNEQHTRLDRRAQRPQLDSLHRKGPVLDGRNARDSIERNVRFPFGGLGARRLPSLHAARPVRGPLRDRMARAEPRWSPVPFGHAGFGTLPAPEGRAIEGPVKLAIENPVWRSALMAGAGREDARGLEPTSGPMVLLPRRRGFTSCQSHPPLSPGSVMRRRCPT